MWGPKSEADGVVLNHGKKAEVLNSKRRKLALPQKEYLGTSLRGRRLAAMIPALAGP